MKVDRITKISEKLTTYAIHVDELYHKKTDRIDGHSHVTIKQSYTLR